MPRTRKSTTRPKRLRKSMPTKRHPTSRAGNSPSADAILADLKQRLAEIYDLNAAGAVLGWDEATYMPAGGAPARGRQSALLRRLAHERFVNPALGRALDRLEPQANKLAAADASLIASARGSGVRGVRVAR